MAINPQPCPPDVGGDCLTDAELRASNVGTADTYLGGEVLADQAGPGVLTFTFTDPVDLLWITSIDADEDQAQTSRADPFGGTPSASVGIPCLDRAQQPITVVTDTVQVYAPSGVTVAVWGYRYAGP